MMKIWVFKASIKTNYISLGCLLITFLCLYCIYIHLFPSFLPGDCYHRELRTKTYANIAIYITNNASPSAQRKQSIFPTHLVTAFTSPPCPGGPLIFPALIGCARHMRSPWGVQPRRATRPGIVGLKPGRPACCMRALKKAACWAFQQALLHPS